MTDRDNLRRALNAENALRLTMLNSGRTVKLPKDEAVLAAGQDNITDLITDLMHYCRWNGLDFEAALSAARDGFDESEYAKPVGY